MKKLEKLTGDDFAKWFYRILGPAAALAVGFVLFRWLVEYSGLTTGLVSIGLFLAAMVLYYSKLGGVLAGLMLIVGGIFVATMAYWQMYTVLGFASPESTAAFIIVLGTIITVGVLALRNFQARPSRTIVFLILLVIIANIFWLPITLAPIFTVVMLAVLLLISAFLLTSATPGRYFWRFLIDKGKESHDEELTGLARALQDKLGDEYTVIGQRRIRYGFRGRHLLIPDAIVIGPTGVFTLCEDLPAGRLRKNGAGVWEIDSDQDLADALSRATNTAQALSNVLCGSVTVSPVAAATPKTQLPAPITTVSVLAPSRSDLAIATLQGAAETISTKKKRWKDHKIRTVTQRVFTHTDPI